MRIHILLKPTFVHFFDSQNARYADIPKIPVLNYISLWWYVFFCHIDIPENLRYNGISDVPRSSKLWHTVIFTRLNNLFYCKCNSIFMLLVACDFWSLTKTNNIYLDAASRAGKLRQSGKAMSKAIAIGCWCSLFLLRVHCQLILAMAAGKCMFLIWAFQVALPCDSNF